MTTTDDDGNGKRQDGVKGQVLDASEGEAGRLTRIRNEFV